MGNLISRAYRRMTQGNQQRSRNDSQSDQQTEATNDPAKRPPRSLVESIPVGQSIDSAEYRALEGNKNTLFLQQQQKQQNQQQTQDKENKQQQQELGSKKRDIEEAAIKIQALVRGHLTRKALKDANQPSLNSLGQSQFDEESLTKNPLSAIFSPTSLMNTAGDLKQQQQQQQQQQGQIQTGRTPLESIAEVVETTAATIGASVQQTADELADMIAKQVEEEKARKEEEEEERGNNNNNNNNSRQKLASICQKQQQEGGDCLASGKREASLCESRDSAVSPVPSEANASIDLNTCDTPASASIDILDHNIRPTDRIASVLHPVGAAKAAAANQTGIEITPSIDEEQPGREETICTPDSLESEEAAAIRIQSAFRGYRTRKNSPYRTRSPNSISASSQNNNSRLRQQDAVVDDDDDDDDEVMDQGEQSAAEKRALDEGRRESRSKQRDSEARAGGVVDSTEESISGATVKEAPRQHLVEDDSSSQMLPSLSLGLSEVGATETLDSEAIETATATAALESNRDDDEQQQAADQDQRPISIGETTGRSFDTDSSILGAALSMNDDAQTATDTRQQPQQQQQQLTTLDEESAAVESAFEFEARRLVEELEELEEAEKVEEATNQLEAALEEEPAEGEQQRQQQQQQPEEQLAIELESDDIERRDPRGQASEERARSPQISGQPIELVAAAAAAAAEDDENIGGNRDDDEPEEQIIEATGSGAKLEAKKPPNEPSACSGRSSPGADSENGSSNESTSNDEQQLRQQQQQSQPAAAGSPSKNKRRNRNKKRGRK